MSVMANGPPPRIEGRPARPPLQFGISVTPYAEQYRGIVEQVLAAERSGLELIGIQDHPYQRRFLDTFALIGDLLARTSRIRMFPDVASLPMRPPAMIAKAASSLDLLSGGRFELGLGAGAFWDAVAGMGGIVRQTGEVLPALEEAIDIIRTALDVGPERRVVRGPGPYYPIAGYPPGPAPAHRIEIWVGAMKPGPLRLIGRKADGWIPGGGISRIAEFPRLSRLIDDAAAEAGRDPRAVRRIANVGGGADSHEQIDLLAHLAGELHFDSFVLWPSDPGTVEIERFAAEIVPAVREAIA
jgi:alkanesulfonate monooxygenase SsuD/methylene tetrahydromethanopterin reductase-like flavin-dependent oxidoreductase (luciferase family)